MNMLFLNRRETTNRLAETQREKIKSNLIVLVNEWRNKCRDGMWLVETIRSVHLFLCPTTTGARAQPGSGGDEAESGGRDRACAHAALPPLSPNRRSRPARRAAAARTDGFVESCLVFWWKAEDALSMSERRVLDREGDGWTFTIHKTTCNCHVSIRWWWWHD